MDHSIAVPNLTETIRNLSEGVASSLHLTREACSEGSIEKREAYCSC